MTPLRVRYTPEAAALIRKFHPDVKRLVRGGIRLLLESPLAGHELRLELAGFRSYRVASYRIIYRYDEREGWLDVYYAGHRRNVYESFRELLVDRASD
jgi:mRNA-degrading endonuclease RelE of RelBE toxin-antitoxin system